MSNNADNDLVLALREQAYIAILDDIATLFKRYECKGEDAVKIMCVGIGQILREQAGSDLHRHIQAAAKLIEAEALHTPPESFEH